MSGINVDNLDKLIEISNFNYDLFSNDIKKLNVNFDELADLYNGIDIDFVFSKLLEQDANLNKLSNTVKSYSETLSNVKTGYQKQDAKFQSLFNNSNIQ